MSKGIKSIGAYAFSDCSSLKKITLNKKLESIGDNAFESTGLVSLKIPSKVKKIGQAVLKSDNKLKSVKVDPKNKYFDSRDDSNAIIKTKDSKIIAACNTTVLPASTKVIGSYSFSGLNKISVIAIPKGTKEIEAYALTGCYKLKRLKMPVSVRTIGKYAFYETSVKEIDYEGRFAAFTSVKTGLHFRPGLVHFNYRAY
ncbi:MAG: leucine-rich repeat domain-containing protein [Clostridiales bacterium]|nr:leucine-rich repeat domain-containing protein [Clostridiales bacterium]